MNSWIHDCIIVLCLIGIIRDHMVSETEQRLLTQLVVSFVIAHESEIWYMRTWHCLTLLCFLFLFFLLYHHINSCITTILELWITFDNWICIWISIAIVLCCVSCDLWLTVSLFHAIVGEGKRRPTWCSIIEKC